MCSLFRTIINFSYFDDCHISFFGDALELMLVDYGVDVWSCSCPASIFPSKSMLPQLIQSMNFYLVIRGSRTTTGNSKCALVLSFKTFVKFYSSRVKCNFQWWSPIALCSFNIHCWSGSCSSWSRIGWHRLKGPGFFLFPLMKGGETSCNYVTFVFPSLLKVEWL